MKLKFDAALDYQREAVQSVTDLFEGLSAQGTLFSTDFGKIDGGMFNELGMGNRDLLPPDQLLWQQHQALRDYFDLPVKRPQKKLAA